VWKFNVHVDSALYDASQFDQQPNYGQRGSVESSQAMPTASLEVRWPLARDGGAWGSQVVEPIVQMIAAPRSSRYINTKIPNEDSLDLEFTDANLFSLNRYPGVDRLEGGMRANVGLHGAWYLPSGATLDAMVGQAYRAERDTSMPVGSGLRQTVSDVVSHVTYTPNQYIDFTSRQRVDHNNADVRFVDALASGGPSYLRLSGGYIYTTSNPYLLYDNPPTTPFISVPRNEVTLGASTKIGAWRLKVNGRQDLQTHKAVSAGAEVIYEDECFIFDLNLYRRYTSINNDSGATTVLFQITLKTVGQFGFNSL
jgi:LPS-assembly protein